MFLYTGFRTLLTSACKLANLLSLGNYIFVCKYACLRAYLNFITYFMFDAPIYSIPPRLIYLVRMIFMRWGTWRLSYFHTHRCSYCRDVSLIYFVIEYERDWQSWAFCTNTESIHPNMFVSYYDRRFVWKKLWKWLRSYFQLHYAYCC